MALLNRIFLITALALFATVSYAESSLPQVSSSTLDTIAQHSAYTLKTRL